MTRLSREQPTWRRCFQSGPTSTPPCSTGLTWKSSTLESGSCRWAPCSHGITAHAQLLLRGKGVNPSLWLCGAAGPKCSRTMCSSVSTELRLGLSHVVFLHLFCKKGASSLADTTKNLKALRRVNLIIKKKDRKTSMLYTVPPFLNLTLGQSSLQRKSKMSAFPTAGVWALWQ